MSDDHQQKKLFLALFIIVSVSFSLFLTYRYFSGPEDGKKGDILNSELIEAGKRSFSSFKGISFKENNEDGIGIEIKAAKADVRNRKLGFLRVAFGKVTEMEDVKITLTENDREVLSISSDYATLYPGSNDVLFQGKVVCSTREGDTLKTEKLFWDNGRKILGTKERYEYTSKEGVSRTGKGFESDKKFAAITLGDGFNMLAKRRIK